MDKSLLVEMKSTGQDYEWYPTTSEIIEVFKTHVSQFHLASLLDIGAGDGKVLITCKELINGCKPELFAIEKSQLLLDTMPSEISIIGTDFWEQSLLDKPLDCIFSNPPYSEFSSWTSKIIREAHSPFLYFVIPSRWKEDKVIENSLNDRKAKIEVLGQFDFLNSEDRQARAKVDLIFIQLCSDYWLNARRSVSYNTRGHEHSVEVDPFDLWISDNFKNDNFNHNKKNEKTEVEERDFKISNSIALGKNLIESLYDHYQEELASLLQNHQNICNLDPALLKEFNITLSTVISGIKLKIKGLKNVYWTKFFDIYAPLTERLISTNRSKFLEVVRSKNNMDFTPSNAYAVTIWSIKNANPYFNSQLVDVFDRMTSLANVTNYKSNERVYKTDKYRYREEKPTHVKLEYRIVLEKVNCSYSSYDTDKGLTKTGRNFLSDILTVAHNLGFERLDQIGFYDFISSGKVEVYSKNKKGDKITLMEVRAFQNGNFHIRFDQDFTLALNVEIGRLKGWLFSTGEAAEELKEPIEKVQSFFKGNYTAIPSQLTQLLLK